MQKVENNSMNSKIKGIYNALHQSKGSNGQATLNQELIIHFISTSGSGCPAGKATNSCTSPMPGRWYQKLLFPVDKCETGGAMDD
jgi:hypothetical protein